MSTTISPNMGITIPTPLSEMGPDYAAEINAGTLIIDSHTHVAGQGLPVVTAGLNINADLPINANNINNARSYRMTNSGIVLSGGSDVNEIYTFNGNLYFNNASGTPIQITNASSINATNTFYSPRSIAANTTILPADTYVYYEVDSSGAAVTINLPSAALVTAGRFYIFKDINGSAQGNNIGIAPNGSDTIDNSNTTVLFKINYLSALLVSDGSSKWFISYYSDPGWLNSIFGNSTIPIVLTGSTANLSAAGGGTVTIGDSTNVLTFLGVSYTFGFEASNTFTVNAYASTFNSSTFTVNSTFTYFNSQVLVHGNMSIGSSSSDFLIVTSTSRFDSPVTINDLMTINNNVIISATYTLVAPTIGVDNLNSSTLVNSHNATLGTSSANILIVNSSASFHAPINITGSTTFTGSSNIFATDATFYSGILTGGSAGYFSGRRVQRFIAATWASNATDFTPCGANGYDVVYFQTVGTPIVITIPATGTEKEGDVITFVRRTASAGSLTINGYDLPPPATVGSGTQPTSSLTLVWNTHPTIGPSAWTVLFAIFP